ncbi:MAG: hypothetical protein AAGA64_17460 [Bacteroidota bacterium]
MKTAKLLWSIGSVLVNVTIGIYIYLMSNAPSELSERFQYINENWTIYGGHWKAEFLIMTLIAIGAFYFAIYWKSISWTIISIGQLIILLTYPIMLGGYRNTPFEVAEMANQMATVTFIFGNLTFFPGLFIMYLKSDVLKSGLRYVALIISAITTLTFAIVYLEIISWNQALVLAPLINVLYLINAYYGFKIKVQ